MILDTVFHVVNQCFSEFLLNFLGKYSVFVLIFSNNQASYNCLVPYLYQG